MKKVLFISHSAGRTGAPLMLLSALRWLKENTDFEFEVLLKEGGELRSDFEALAPTRVLGETDSPGFWNRTGTRKLPRFWRFWDVSLENLADYYKGIGVGLIYANTITLGSVLDRLKLVNCPVITHVHELSHWIDRCGVENLAQVLQYSDHFIAASGAVKNNLVQNYRISAVKIEVIHSFVDIHSIKTDGAVAARLRSELAIEDGQKIVTGSGFETHRKGKDLFVELGAILHKSAPGLDWKFVWIGGWESASDRKEIIGMAREKGLSDLFKFVGEVKNPLDYFELGDIFALVSREEPLGLVGLEASLLGKPIVCFQDAGGMPEFVGTDAGICVPFLDVSAMATAILSLLNEPELARRLNRRAIEKIRDHYEVSVGAGAMAKAIRSVLYSTHGDSNAAC